MDIYMKRKKGESVLVPMSAAEEELLRKIPEHVPLKVKIKRPRNPNHFRLFMALLRFVFEQQEKYDVIEHLRDAILIDAGLYTHFIKESGEIVYIPIDLSFDNVGEDEFKIIKSKMIDVILRKYLVGQTAEDLDKQARNILSFV